MPPVTIVLPAGFAGGLQVSTADCDAGTVGEALQQIAASQPRLAPRIFYGDRLLVAVTLNGRHLPPAQVLDAVLAEGDRIELLLPVAGG